MDKINVYNKKLVDENPNFLLRSDGFGGYNNPHKLGFEEFFARLQRNNQGSPLDKVIGQIEVVAILKQLVSILKDPGVSERFKGLGLDLPRLLILHGPPGTGKTFSVKCFAEALGTGVVALKSSDINSKWVGESAANFREHYEQARKMAAEKGYAVLFLDEAEGIIPHIGGSQPHTTGNGQQLRNEILQHLQGFDGANDGVIVIASTNFLEKIDQAFVNRAEHVIHVGRPNLPELIQLLEYWEKKLKKKGVKLNVDKEEISRMLYGAAGRDIEDMFQTILRSKALTGDVGEITTEDLQSYISQNSRKWQPKRVFPSYKPDRQCNFEDVKGQGHVIQRLRLVSRCFNQPERAQNLGISLPNSIIFHGVPGTGKTMVARALAEAIHGEMLVVKPGDILVNAAGNFIQNLKRLFDEAKESAIRRGHCIIFIDEIEALLGERIDPILRNEFLQFLDGMNKASDVLLIGATNFVDQLDRAFLDRSESIKFQMPDLEAKRVILADCIKTGLSGIEERIQWDYETDISVLNTYLSKLSPRRIVAIVNRVITILKEDLLLSDDENVSVLMTIEMLNEAFEQESNDTDGVRNLVRRNIGFLH